MLDLPHAARTDHHFAAANRTTGTLVRNNLTSRSSVSVARIIPSWRGRGCIPVCWWRRRGRIPVCGWRRWGRIPVPVSRWWRSGRGRRTTHSPQRAARQSANGGALAPARDPADRRPRACSQQSTAHGTLARVIRVGAAGKHRQAERGKNQTARGHTANRHQELLHGRDQSGIHRRWRCGGTSYLPGAYRTTPSPCMNSRVNRAGFRSVAVVGALGSMRQPISHGPSSRSACATSSSNAPSSAAQAL